MPSAIVSVIPRLPGTSTRGAGAHDRGPIIKPFDKLREMTFSVSTCSELRRQRRMARLLARLPKILPLIFLSYAGLGPEVRIIRSRHDPDPDPQSVEEHESSLLS